MIKLLIGGSPCTHWSIAQTKDRETTASGLGWELFKNYLYAKERFQPDFFLYENNKSAAQAIKDQISEELGTKLMYINSALVSAQNRQRFYAFNWHVQQPADRGILLKDILEGNENTSVCGQGGGLGAKTGLYAVPIKLADIGNGGQGNRLYSVEGKAVTQTAGGGGIGSNTGLYAIPVNTTTNGKAQCLRATCYKDGIRNMVGNTIDRRTCVAEPVENVGEAKTVQKSIHEVKDGKITINGKQYQIKLTDGFYIIRKLTVTECCRLQTMPDDYCRAVSNAQAYKGLGNGWTAEVIIHILSSALKDVPKDEEIVVLSMYDGIGTGRYCLDKMGFTNVKYFAYEIDKYAKQIAMSNYPDIIQMGDAFQLRHPDWTIGY